MRIFKYDISQQNTKYRRRTAFAQFYEEVETMEEAIKKFLMLATNASECRVKKIKKSNLVKLKLRLKRYLYTLKLPEDKAREVLKLIKCPIRELP